MSDTTYDRGAAVTPVDLSRYDEDYRKAKQADTPPPYRPVPDGKYQVIIESVELTTTRTTGNPMLKWRLRIAGPAMAGRILWKNSVITERSIPFVTQDLNLCSVSMQSMNELPGKLPELVDLRLEVTKRGKADGHEDVYFDRNLTATPLTNAASATASASASQPAASGTQPYDAAERSSPFDEDVNDDLPF